MKTHAIAGLAIIAVTAIAMDYAVSPGSGEAAPATAHGPAHADASRDTTDA